MDEAGWHPAQPPRRSRIVAGERKKEKSGGGRKKEEKDERKAEMDEQISGEAVGLRRLECQGGDI